jgi:hypothetical protein
MSNYLFIRSKFEIKREILLKANKNVNSNYLKNKHKFINYKTKNYNYYVVLNAQSPKNIFKSKNGIVV